LSYIPRFIAFIIWYPCVVIQVILFAYADKPAVDLKRAENEVIFTSLFFYDFQKRSEEKVSSFINRQTMTWFNKICAIGVRKPLEVNDLYPLNDEDTSNVLIGRWNVCWDKAMKGKVVIIYTITIIYRLQR
jgi:mRNA-degrading endonuclease YafQ of YafQ-DinJ toxin-antitoxin module